MNAEIIICTERGQLENQSKLCVASLRKFGGKFKDLPIKSFQVRDGYRIKKSTLQFFEKHNVEHRELILNKEFSFYPQGNKPLICSYMEQNSKAEYLIFLDSDTLFINEPNKFELPADKDLGIRAVGRQGIGVSNEQQANYPQWKALYEMLGVENIRRVKSLIDQQDIFEYYNSGQIISKRASGLFQQWETNFRKVMASTIRPTEEFYMDQFVLGPTVSQLALNVYNLPTSYNYPVYFLKKGKEVSNHPAYLSELDDIVSVHYHKIFDGPLRENILKTWFSKSEKGNELKAMIDSLLKPQKRSFFNFLRK